MCETCGCHDDAGVRVIDLDATDAREPAAATTHSHTTTHANATTHADSTTHSHGLSHHHESQTHSGTESVRDASAETPVPTRVVPLEERVLAKNDDLATANRAWFADRGITALNIMSSPGSGKTTLLVRTIRDLATEFPISVIEGDQETTFDARRIRDAGCRAIQINTGSGCHLDASMLADGVRALDPPQRSLVFIENVGNLVCPALFDLGEAARVVIMSVPEGADKPLKYPHMFRTADLVVINKIDLLPYVDFDIDACRRAVAVLNPRATIVETSATRGDGLADWYGWLRTAAPGTLAPEPAVSY